MIITTSLASPDKSISHLVQSFWMLENPSGQSVESTILPDGMIDLFVLRRSYTTPFETVLKGIETVPGPAIIPPGIKMFAIGFKPLAVEYILQTSIAGIRNIGQPLTDPHWQFDPEDLKSFDLFTKAATRKINTTPSIPIDPRKQQLFDLLLTHNGALTVQELSEKVFWSARQINRYFNQRFGLSLKAYSNIIRFRASLQHIKEGKLFPEQNFFDQAHFIKEVKKLAGVAPKELKDNKNDRFLQLSVLPKK